MQHAFEAAVDLDCGELEMWCELPGEVAEVLQELLVTIVIPSNSDATSVIPSEAETTSSW